MDTDAAAQGMSTLQIGVETVGRGEVTVSVRGELDCATNDQLRAALTELLNGGGITAIGLDLRGLEFIDSTGIGTLVVAQRICREVGVRLRLTAVNAFAARVLGVIGVDAALGLPATATRASAADAAALVGAD